MDSFLGKVLRMTLDGRPAPNNPFYQDGDIGNSQNYIWASGLRNPFGLRVVDGKVFVMSGYSGNISSSVEVFDVASQTWSAGPAMSTARNCHAAAVVDGKVSLYGLANFWGSVRQNHAHPFVRAVSSMPMELFRAR